MSSLPYFPPLGLSCGVVVGGVQVWVGDMASGCWGVFSAEVCTEMAPLLRIVGRWRRLSGDGLYFRPANLVLFH